MKMVTISTRVQAPDEATHFSGFDPAKITWWKLSRPNEFGIFSGWCCFDEKRNQWFDYTAQWPDLIFQIPEPTSKTGDHDD